MEFYSFHILFYLKIHLLPKALFFFFFFEGEGVAEKPKTKLRVVWESKLMVIASGLEN